MRGEVNLYRFEISNQRENKFCSHEAAFQNNPIFWWTCADISFRVVYTWYFIARNEISSLKMTNMKSVLVLSFKDTSALNATSKSLRLSISFSHKNLMLVLNLISVKMTDMKSIRFWVSFRLNSSEHK